MNCGAQKFLIYCQVALVLIMVATRPASAADKVTYFKVDFPITKDPIAEISYSLRDAQGKHRFSKRASGRFTLPKNVGLTIELRPGIVTTPTLLRQLLPGRVVEINANAIEFGDEQLKYLLDFRKIKKLSLRGTDITDKALTTVGTFSNLAYLRLDATLLTGKTFSDLLPLTKLVRLDLSGTNLERGSVTKLKPLFPQLENLAIKRCRLTQSDMPALNALTNIEDLDLSANKEVNDASLKNLVGLKKLRKLNIDETSITFKALDTLKSMPALKEVVVRGKQFGERNYKAYCPAITFIDPAGKRDVPVEIFAPLH